MGDLNNRENMNILENERVVASYDFGNGHAFRIMITGKINRTMIKAMHALIDFQEPVDIYNNNSKSIKQQIIEAAERMIQPGEHVTTKKILNALQLENNNFQNVPSSLITHVISGTGRYKGHKSLGWSIK